MRPAAVLGLALVCMLLAPAGAAHAAKPVKPACGDRIDNDGDGLADYDRRGGDPDCLSRKDHSEATCGDDDGDGAIDETGVLAHVTAIDCIGTVPRIQTCEVDYHDLNGVVADGCEYGPVAVTGPETCDGLDNDADGSIDEGLARSVTHGTVVCEQAGLVLVCDPGWSDVNGDVADGCEYTPPPPVGPEACDGIDNDRDGAVDEDLTYPPVANGTLSCEEGHVVLRCDAGFSDLNGDRGDGCEGPTPPPDPRIEQCDGLDNDGDGSFDEGVVFPPVANGELICVQGSPQVLCQPGFADSNGDPFDGCEAAAAPEARARG